MLNDFGTFAALLTVYTVRGEVEVGGVREDSIEHDEDGTLICEGHDVRNPRLYRFRDVLGYSTILV